MFYCKLIQLVKPLNHIDLDNIETSNLSEKVNSLLKKDNIDSVIPYINDNLDSTILNSIYNKAVEYFYSKKYELAENLYIQLMTLRSPANLTLVDKCEFDLRLIYINQQNYEKALTFKRQGNFLVLNCNFNIKSLIHTYCLYQQLKSKENNLKSSLDDQQIANLNKTLNYIYNENLKNENRDSVKDVLGANLSYKNYSLIQQSLNLPDRINATFKKIIDDYYFLYKEIAGNLSAFLFGNTDLEFKYLANLPINLVNYDQIENTYVGYFEKYLQEKIIASKILNELETTIDDYGKILEFDQVAITVSPKVLSEDEILYAFFKQAVFYSNSLMGLTAYKLIKDKSIIKPSMLQKAFEKLYVVYAKNSPADNFYNNLAELKPNNFDFLIKYAISSLLFKDDYDKSGKLFHTIIKNKDKTNQTNIMIALLGNQYLLHLLNYPNIKKINDSFIKNAEVVAKLLINEYGKKYNFTFDVSQSVNNNLKFLINKIGAYFDTDIRLVFLETILRITHNFN